MINTLTAPSFFQNLEEKIQQPKRRDKDAIFPDQRYFHQCDNYFFSYYDSGRGIIMHLQPISFASLNPNSKHKLTEFPHL